MFLAVGLLLMVLITYKFLDWLLRSLILGGASEKYVFISGCDSGFGSRLAAHLDSLGFHVFAACQTKEGAELLQETCSRSITTVLLDMTENESTEAAFQVVEKKLPAKKGLWALVNNAGICGNLVKTEFYSKDDFQQVLEINLLVLVEMTKKFLPLVRKSRGRIVNVSNIAERVAPSAAPYSASQFGIEAFSDVLRREVYRQGIKVSIVETGLSKISTVNKDNLITSARQLYERASPEVKDAYNVELLLVKLKDMLSNREGNDTLAVWPVVNAMTHAVIARFPRTRYIVGTGAKFIFSPILYLPDWMSDPITKAILRKSEQAVQ